MDLNKKHSLKASVLILLIGLVLIFLIMLASPPDSPFIAQSINNEDDAAAFLAELGWESDPQTISIQNSVLPTEFDSLFTEYNNLQLQQGCDLSKYTGKEITVYTAPIKNYSNTSENIYATIIVHKNQVIGGDIHSADLNGFMHTLR